jgi:leukotriene-A4 hydrolase
MALVVGDLKY